MVGGTPVPSSHLGRRARCAISNPRQLRRDLQAPIGAGDSGRAPLPPLKLESRAAFDLRPRSLGRGMRWDRKGRRLESAGSFQSASFVWMARRRSPVPPLAGNHACARTASQSLRAHRCHQGKRRVGFVPGEVALKPQNGPSTRDSSHPEIKHELWIANGPSAEARRRNAVLLQVLLDAFKQRNTPLALLPNRLAFFLCS
jgi:hypothetical protein